jgi:RNA polymerase sigma-70 factor, ECF subfamily
MLRSMSRSYSRDDSDLVGLASTGDLEAFNQLVLQHQNVAYNHAYVLLGDHALAEDVTQECFIKAFRNMAGFRGGSFRAWLLKIVTNSAYDFLRRLQRYPTQPLFFMDKKGEEIESPHWLTDPGPSVQDTVEQDELSKDIYKLLDGLPDVYRSVLTFIDVHDLDYLETAQALKIPIGTVKSRLARARLKLKEKLKGRPEFVQDKTIYQNSKSGNKMSISTVFLQEKK